MAIKISGTTVIDDNKNLVNINDITANGNVSINTITFPITDGSAGQAIVTDGSGNLTFKSISAPAYSVF